MAETTDSREPSPTETLLAVMEPALSPPEIPTVTVPPVPELSTTDVVPDPAMSDTVVEVPSTLTTPSVPWTVDPADRPSAARADPPVICRDAADPCSVVATRAPRMWSRSGEGCPRRPLDRLRQLASAYRCPTPG